MNYMGSLEILLFGLAIMLCCLFMFVPIQQRSLFEIINEIFKIKLECGDIIKQNPPDWVEQWHIYESESWEVVAIGKRSIRVRCDVADTAYQSNIHYHRTRVNTTKTTGEKGDGYYYWDLDKNLYRNGFYILKDSKYRIRKRFNKRFLKY